MVLVGVAIWAIANCPSGLSCLLTSTTAKGLRHKIATPPLLVEYLEQGTCRSCQPRFLATWAIPGAATALMFVSCKVITWTPSWAADKKKVFSVCIPPLDILGPQLEFMAGIGGWRFHWSRVRSFTYPDPSQAPSRGLSSLAFLRELLMVEGLSGWCFSLFLFLFLKLRVGGLTLPNSLSFLNRRNRSFS